MLGHIEKDQQYCCCNQTKKTFKEMNFKALFGFLVCLSLGCCTDYWVTPNTVEKCPSGIPQRACITISDMVTGNSGGFIVNETDSVHFLPGLHVPTVSGWIVFEKYMHNVSIIGEVEKDCDLNVHYQVYF